MSLLKVKVTSKSESKLYNYIKVFLSLLYFLYKNTTHNKCHNVFMYDEEIKILIHK